MADQRHDFEQRPSPDALLEAARREQTDVGKLRIFVGAAPGVGKTYEMLQQARAKRRDGADVIVMDAGRPKPCSTGCPSSPASRWPTAAR
jgi:two-component system, OmpR family, sensor histidine kinase KdpD